MAAFITYNNQSIKLNNRGFEKIIQMVIESAGLDADEDEKSHIIQLEDFWDKEYWNGRGFEIEEDFQDITVAKFWSIAFYNLASRIFNREIGDHSDKHWQAFMIHRAVSIGELLEQYVISQEPNWRIEGLTIDTYSLPPIFKFKT